MLLPGCPGHARPAVDVRGRGQCLAEFEAGHCRLAEPCLRSELVPGQARIQAKSPQRQAKTAKRLGNVT